MRENTKSRTGYSTSCESRDHYMKEDLVEEIVIHETTLQLHKTISEEGSTLSCFLPFLSLISFWDEKEEGESIPLILRCEALSSLSECLLFSPSLLSSFISPLQSLIEDGDQPVKVRLKGLEVWNKVRVDLDYYFVRYFPCLDIQIQHTFPLHSSESHS